MLLKYLDNIGFQCTATEITKERGLKYLNESKTIEIKPTDGINLTNFERNSSYDIVISDQVIEHFHPDDIITHFKEVYSILTLGGKYIFSTPHKYTGPHDISLVFKSKQCQGMHLKEYTYKELISVAKLSGFTKINIAYHKPFLKLFFLKAYKMTEYLISFIPTQFFKKIFLFHDNIFLIIEK